VLYALSSFFIVLFLYAKEGLLYYEYNLFEIARTRIKAKSKFHSGREKIEVVTKYAVMAIALRCVGLSKNKLVLKPES
jgi:arylsulfatase